MLEHVSIILNLLFTGSILLYGYAICLSSTVQGHLGHFIVLAITNKAAMNTSIQVFVRTQVFLSVG